MLKKRIKVAGKPLELVFLIIFSLMLITVFVYPPWEYYDFKSATKKVPLLFSFFAYLNHLFYVFLGWAGLLIAPALIHTCWHLLRRKNEKAVYQMTYVKLIFVALLALCMGCFDGIFFNQKFLSGGILGRSFENQILVGIWRWPVLFILVFAGISFFFKYFLKDSFPQLLWSWLSNFSTLFVKRDLPEQAKSLLTGGEGNVYHPPEPERDDNSDVLIYRTIRRGNSKPDIDEPPWLSDVVEEEIIEPDRQGVATENIHELTNDTAKQNIPEKVVNIQPTERKRISLDLRPLNVNCDMPDPAVLGSLPTMPPVKKEDINLLADIIETKLREFDVGVTVTPVGTGPFLAQFSIRPKPGVSIDKVRTREEDIRLALGKDSLRFITTGVEAGTIMCEVPLAEQTPVYYRDILRRVNHDNGSVPWFIVGVDITGKPVVQTFEETPHLLIAGVTGSGKSVFLNSLIVHLLLHFKPSELRLLLVDAKRLELSLYEPVPHLACPVVVDVDTLETVLEQLIIEMEERYEIIGRYGLRSLTEYIEMCKRENKEPDLCYSVVIIDELAEFLLTGTDRMEKMLIRIAKMSRAVGIYLVLATQRPTANIISSNIKENFDMRISFRLPTKVDSRVILDENGAEALLQRGDMLFKHAGSPLKRVHSGNMTTEEVKMFTDWWKRNKNLEK